MVTKSSHSISMCPPHSPTRITKNSILKLAGAFHWPNTSRIRFWAFSYSVGEPCGRSNQLITYFIGILLGRVDPTFLHLHYQFWSASQARWRRSAPDQLHPPVLRASFVGRVVGNRRRRAVAARRQ